ncbi:MAG: hypothetical protein OXG69_17440, partial [bacterium]|nr:hypothetical protein [bacterium]
KVDCPRYSGRESGPNDAPETYGITGTEIGLSIHNGGHLTLAPRMVEAVRAAGLDVPVVVGGIVPDMDLERLGDAGVFAVLGPGASATEVAEVVRAAATARA